MSRRASKMDGGAHALFDAMCWAQQHLGRLPPHAPQQLAYRLYELDGPSSHGEKERVVAALEPVLPEVHVVLCSSDVEQQAVAEVLPCHKTPQPYLHHRLWVLVALHEARAPMKSVQIMGKAFVHRGPKVMAMHPARSPIKPQRH